MDFAKRQLNDQYRGLRVLKQGLVRALAITSCGYIICMTSFLVSIILISRKVLLGGLIIVTRLVPTMSITLA